MLVDVNSEAAEFSTNAYAKANAVAYEVIANIRTVLSVNGTKRMAKRYFDQTEAAESMGGKLKVASRYLLVIMHSWS